MSEGFELEPFHVPQQSRRDKLRESPTTLHAGLLYPLCYPSSLLSSAALPKEAESNFLGFAGSGSGASGFSIPSSCTSSSSSSSPSSSSSQILLDRHQSSISLAQTFAQEDVNGAAGSSFLYLPQIPDNQMILGDYDGPSFELQPNVGYAPGALVSTGEGLSLSLSSNCSEGFNLFRGISGGDPTARSTVPLGPFTGYAAVLKGSRFLKPAHQLLEDLCDASRRSRVAGNSGGLSGLSAELCDTEGLMVFEDGGAGSSGGGGKRRRMKATLISMLGEVCRRYEQYHQQLQAVSKSFESVAGLGTAAPYIALAIKIMSKYFHSLKSAITDQLHFTVIANDESSIKEKGMCFGFVDQGIQQQDLARSLGILSQTHVWRPQRGLPERAVAVLRAWLFEHFLHPYPTDADKQMLAKRTGLNRNQVSNWFINARVRLWKPMVEEIHSLEMRQGQKAPDGEKNNANGQSKSASAMVSSIAKQMQNPSDQTNHNPLPKRYRNKEPDNFNELVDLPCNNIHGIGVSLANENGGISLTLGLPQNNGNGLSDPLPLAVAHFGLEESTSSYMMEGFESQNRADVNGQLLGNFVG